MTEAEREALESQVDRHVRRGELSEAFGALEKLVQAFPDDAGLADRLAQLEASLDPSERRRVAVTRIDPTGGHKSPMHLAEAHAAAGRYAEAISIYRTLLASRPDWDLVKERLAELFQLAQVAAPPKTTVNREAVLEHLLERISTRKRG
jgi:tetratricopeptide (TPR) repeat protein